MIQYFQLTPDILLEYIYEGEPKLNSDGIGNVKDIYDDYPTMLLNSNAFGSKYLCFKDISESDSELTPENFVSLSNLVLPLNNNETQFVVAKSKYQNFFSKINATNIYTTRNGSGYMYEDTNYDKSIREKKESCDIKYDRCVIHFTSGNYFGSYDSLIFQAYAYMSNKSKLYFASFLFRKTSDTKLKSEHLLYNEKLYTAQIEFDIPSVFSIFNPNQYDGEGQKNGEGQKKFNDALKSQGVELLENTPIGINVYGVSGSIKKLDNNDYEKLKTLKINSIYIPYIDNISNEIYVNIYEAEDGDYYYIDPEMGSGYSSFADYIEKMGENIGAYMIMHELKLREIWVDTNNDPHDEVTHKEFHIIDINEDDEKDVINRNFDAKIKYRPICTQGGKNYKAIITDTIKIINTIDNTSYEITGSLDIANPNKYGKRLKRLDIKDESRPIVNVYNKKVSDESGRNSINLNRGGGFVVENNTQNITSFIECTNIGVSIVELSPDDIN
jgi:hypothetical protein